MYSSRVIINSEFLVQLKNHYISISLSSYNQNSSVHQDIIRDVALLIPEKWRSDLGMRIPSVCLLRKHIFPTVRMHRILLSGLSSAPI